MQINRLALVLLIGVAVGCSRRDQRDERLDPDSHTAAHKVGAAAYDVAHESEKLAKKAGAKLKEATHEAHEGWKDAAQEHKNKTQQ